VHRKDQQFEEGNEQVMMCRRYMSTLSFVSGTFRVNELILS